MTDSYIAWYNIMLYVGSVYGGYLTYDFANAVRDGKLPANLATWVMYVLLNVVQLYLQVELWQNHGGAIPTLEVAWLVASVYGLYHVARQPSHMTKFDKKDYACVTLAILSVLIWVSGMKYISLIANGIAVVLATLPQVIDFLKDKKSASDSRHFWLRATLARALTVPANGTQVLAQIIPFVDCAVCVTTYIVCKVQHKRL